MRHEALAAARFVGPGGADGDPLLLFKDGIENWLRQIPDDSQVVPLGHIEIQIRPTTFGTKDNAPAQATGMVARTVASTRGTLVKH